jgi:hypothetical protein
VTFPTRSELQAEVDSEFFAQHPQAPRRLDPNDPSQAGLVEAWNELYKTKVYKWTDVIFRANNPWFSGQLSADGPDDAQLREQWLWMRDRILAEGPAVFWGGQQPGSGGGSGGGSGSPRLQSARALDEASYAFAFDGPVEPHDVSAWLWPEGAPYGVEVVPLGPTEVQLTGVSGDTLASLPPDVAATVSEAWA